MYRCTECNAEYMECPDYCVCGNDTFQEVLDEDYIEEEEYVRPKPKKQKLTPEEIEEIEADKLDKRKHLLLLQLHCSFVL